MRYIVLLFVLLIVTGLLLQTFSTKPSAVYTKALELQQNPFAAAKDSEALIWKRAIQYIDEHRALISGGDLQQTDSTIYIPYYNDHKKGNSLLIEKHTSADSVIFKVQWFYSQKLQLNGSRKLALFMQKRIREE